MSEPNGPDLGWADAPVETVIVPRARDLGGFEVRRVLPAAQRQMIGPFIFLDQMGPADFGPGEGINVRPHPHINLATITYLFEGEILHRDSLGTEQLIHPGEVNLMTAGRGIAHSERARPEIRARGAAMFGMQSWIALPSAEEETEPAFSHHGAADLPLIEDMGKSVRLIAGTLYGATSPVPTYSEMFYADARLEAGASLPLDPEHEQRGVYVASGAVEIGRTAFEAGQMIVLRPGERVTLTAQEPARLMLLGGAALDGLRYIWWNFVSSRRERIEQAKADWKARRFAVVPGDGTEFIPLPETVPDENKVVRYP